MPADSDTSLVTSRDRLVLDRSTRCRVEPRMMDGSPGPVVSTFKRACPGEPPTIEAFIATRNGSIHAADHGNALVVDAAADSPAHPVLIRVVRRSRTNVVFDVDHRARIRYIGSQVDGVNVAAMGGTP